MNDLTIVPLEEGHLEQARSWANQDAAPRLFRMPPSASLPQDTLGWVMLRDNQPIAILTVMSDSGRPYLDFLVKPSERRQGIGARMLRHALEQPGVQSLYGLHAYVELDNTAAQKLLSREGFSRIGYADDGRLEYERH